MVRRPFAFLPCDWYRHSRPGPRAHLFGTHVGAPSTSKRLNSRLAPNGLIADIADDGSISVRVYSEGRVVRWPAWVHDLSYDCDTVHLRERAENVGRRMARDPQIADAFLALTSLATDDEASYADIRERFLDEVAKGSR